MPKFRHSSHSENETIQEFVYIVPSLDIDLQQRQICNLKLQHVTAWPFMESNSDTLWAELWSNI